MKKWLILILLIFPFSASAAFPDIQDHQYQASIEFIEERKLVAGYPDGTFKPDANINRAEIILIIVKRNYPALPIKDCFTDVKASEWYSAYACKGLELGIIAGYPDGSFGGGNNVNFAEALLMFQRAYGIPVSTASGDNWFENSMEIARNLDFIPPDVTEPGQKLTRGQVADMMARFIRYKEVPFDPATAPLLQLEDLEYQGAFRVPDGNFGESNFSYGGIGATLYPEHNSLFLLGHDHHQMIAEIEIPEIVKSNSLGDLKVAKVLQNFADPTDGKRDGVDPGSPGGVKIGGLLVYRQKLYGTVYSYYDTDKSQTVSHFISPLDIGKPDDGEGIFTIGDLGASYYSGYMAYVPEEWQPFLGGPAFVGQCCVAIVGRTSHGPGVFVFDPEKINKDTPAPTTPLVYYPGDQLGKYDSQNDYWNGTTVIRSVVLPTRTRSVLFFGRHGKGSFCYGTGKQCGDPVNANNGPHAAPYVYQVWAYDALDLIAVKEKKKEPWDVRPYALWNFDLPFPPDDGIPGIPGVAYDPQTSRLYVAQRHGDQARPVIHVYKVLKPATAR